MKARFDSPTGGAGRIGARALLAALVALLVGVVVLPSSAFGQSPTPSPTGSGSPTPSNSPSGSPTKSPSSSPSASPSASASPAKPIEILNPIPQEQAGGELADEALVSDQPTPENATYKLAAWVPTVPPGAVVEFEVSTVPPTTIEATGRIGDTFFAEWAIPNTLSDGSRTLTAILFSGVGGTEIGRDTMPIIIKQGVGALIPPPDAAATVDLTNPGETGSVGFYQPTGKPWRAVLNAVTSQDTTFVEFLYTLSKPGTQPEWKSCGFATVSSQSARLVCVLADKEDGTKVTAIGAVANTTDEDVGSEFGADPEFNESTDAQRVIPYVQIPSSVTTTPETQRVEMASNGTFPCAQVLSVKVLDQVGKAIPGANVDVSAVGPDDSLGFSLNTNNTTRTTSTLQAPDKGPHVKELGFNCQGSTTATNTGQQGEHNIAGGDDEKHIESVAGTNIDGIFTFNIHSFAAGTTQLTASVDLNDDDILDVEEPVDGAAIGWGESPAPASPQLFISPTSAEGGLNDCVRFALVARKGGSPEPSQNVDIHITGDGAAFCDPADASPRRDPDLGGHTGPSEGDDSTLHQEGETGPNGTFIFGVTSSSPGDVNVFAWLDTTEDDVFADEPSASGGATFAATGDRLITLESSKNRQRSGRSVNFFGFIEGERVCEDNQIVKLKSRAGSKRFRTIASTATDSEGGYSFRIKVKRTKDYRAIAPKNDSCKAAKSNRVRVRAR